MKHHDRNYNDIISRQKMLNNRIVKLFVALILALLIAFTMTSCNSVINATSASGEALEAKGNYGYVRLDAERGKADYNTFLEVYFPYQVKKGEKVFVVTQTYLDSLRASKQ